MVQPAVSVIIPVYNAERTLQACVDSLDAQDREGVEVIFVDDGSTDASPDILVRSGHRVILGQHRGPSAARNLGVEAARAPLVAFTDSDCLVPPHWLSTLERALEQSHAVGAGGGQRSPEDESPKGLAHQRILCQLGFVGDYTSGASTLTPVKHNPTCNVLYRREVIQRVGGFREDLFPGEDVDLDHRLAAQGHTFVRVPGAEVAHYRADTHRGFGRMMYRYGWAQARLVRIHGPFRPLHYLPILSAGVGLSLAVGLVLAPVPVLLGSGALGLFGYLALCIRSRALVRPDLAGLVVVAWHLGFARGILQDPRRSDHG